MGKHRAKEKSGNRAWRSRAFLMLVLLVVLGGGAWVAADYFRQDRAAAAEPTPPVQTPAPEMTPALSTGTASTPTLTAQPSPEPADSLTIRLMAVGDLMNHDANLSAARVGEGYDFTPVFQDIAPTLARADLVVGNLETTIGQAPHSGFPVFCSPAEYLDALAGAGFDVLTLANNHMLDKGVDGLASTVAALEERGIPYAGAYASQEASEQILILDVQGVRVAILAYAEYCNGSTGVPYALNYLREDDIAWDIPAAREAGADIVVVMVHWGVEYADQPSSQQRFWAQCLAQAGADIVLGAHPHVLQPAQWLETTLEDGQVHRTFVAYSMGNFISNQRTQPRDAGIIFDISIRKDLATGEVALGEVFYIPTWVFRGMEGEVPVSYAVLPAGKYQEEAYPGMTIYDHWRVQRVWSETLERMGEEAAKPLIE